MLRLVAVVAGAALLAACSTTAEPRDELQVTDSVTAATPAVSPSASSPQGTVIPLADKVNAVVAVPKARVIALGTASPSLLLLNLDDPAAPPRSVPLPGPASALTATPDGVLASIGTAKQLVRVALPAGTTSTVQVDGTPGAATVNGDKTLVPLSDRKAVDVVQNDKSQRQISGSMFSADQVLTVGSNAVVLDRLRTAVFDLNLAENKVGVGQRAGNGATNATTDRFNRVLVTDTRGNALLAFATNPVLLKQRYPVPGAPYGIAYDSKRDLVWVTLTERNEVVGYNVAGGEPRETHRFTSVVQPNSVTVDPDSGRVFVASATGGGIQVMQP